MKEGVWIHHAGRWGRGFFVYANGLIDEINGGDKVSYNVEEGPKGTSAINVKIA